MSWKTILKGLSEKEKNDTSAKLRQELINAKDLTNQQTKEIKKRILNLKNKSDSMFPFEVQYLRARIAGKTDMQALTEIYNKNKRGD
jgi:hypothetical protein|tara:strand:+ start:395 stop:655 length:261 start_codon:yes stop_codon:yes gene_type:complete